MINLSNIHINYHKLQYIFLLEAQANFVARHKAHYEATYGPRYKYPNSPHGPNIRAFENLKRRTHINSQYICFQAEVHLVDCCKARFEA